MDNEEKILDEPQVGGKEAVAGPGKSQKYSGQMAAVFSAFCLYCAIVFCFFGLDTYGKGAAELGPFEAICSALLLLPATMGVIASTLLVLTMLVFPKRPARKFYWFLALGLNVLTITLFVNFHWIAPILVKMAEQN